MEEQIENAEFQIFKNNQMIFGFLSGKTQSFASCFLRNVSKGFSFENSLNRIVLFFGTQETKFIKAFDSDQMAFEFQILDFKRLKFQIDSLQNLIFNNEKGEEFETYRAEIERRLEKICVLFSSCESPLRVKKLQSILNSEDFYLPLFRFLTIENHTNIQNMLKTEEIALKSSNMLMNLIVRLLQFFCNKNPKIREFSHYYVFDLLETLDNGLDVSRLLFLILSEFI